MTILFGVIVIAVVMVTIQEEIDRIEQLDKEEEELSKEKPWNN